jgi:DNA ligase (NAD+)
MLRGLREEGAGRAGVDDVPRAVDVSRVKTPAERHAELCREIQAHAYRYYVLDDPSVSDAEYDALYRALAALESEHPELVSPDSPTQRVGSEPRSELPKYERPIPMFSLGNVYSEVDLREFDERVRKGLPERDVVQYVAEPKLDGASVEVVYEIDRAQLAARLALVTTRGDGKIGEVVTHNARTFRGVPLRVSIRPEIAEKVDRLTFRGEVVIYREDFDALNAERERSGEAPFANPRNFASGTLRMLDPRVVASRPLRLVLYQFVEGPRLHASHADSIAWMTKLGLPTHRREVLCRSVDELLASISDFDRAREGYPFETDGVVVKVDEYRQQDVLGETAKEPRWAVAFKFAAERARTRVRAIHVQVGRTGALTPVVNVDPVPLAGTTVSRASLHNFDQVAKLDVRVGDLVEIEKAGEIIPQVVSVILAERPEGTNVLPVPTRCPECDTEVVRSGEEVALRCPNRRCPAVVGAALHYFARRFAMDIEDLGPKLIEQLVAKKLVSDVADLYDLTVERVASLERKAEKSAANVVAEIASSKARAFDRLLCALGIPQIGQVAAKQLAAEVPSLEEAIALGADGVAEKAAHIHGFGPAMVDALRAWLSDAPNRALLEKLRAHDVSRPFVVERAAKAGPLVGVSVCVTGVLSRKREAVHDDVRAAGGDVHDSVRAGTTLLVAGEKTGQSKLDAAKKRGTKVIDEPTLGKLLSGELAPAELLGAPIEKAAPEPTEAPAKAEKKAPRAKKPKKGEQAALFAAGDADEGAPDDDGS